MQTGASIVELENMMRALRLVFFAAVFLVAIPLAAADSAGEPTEKSEKTEVTEKTKPDYSKHAMMIFVWEIVDQEDDPFAPWAYSVSALDARIGFQLAVPMGVETATFNALPDPFALTGVSAAYTPETFKDRWGIWWAERRLGIKP